MPGNKTKLFFETWQVFIAYIGKQILPFVSRQSIITPSDTKTTGQPLLQAEAKKPFSQALHPAYESSFWKVSFSMNETVTKRFLLYFRLMMVAWILIANAFFHAIEFEYSWLIFLSNIMLFTMEGDIKDRFISVELGGLVGMVLTVLAMLAIGTLTPVLGGMLGLLLPLGVVLFNFRRLPEVVELIVANAFGWEQAMGGGVGAALMQGIKRGLFSNEAGMGSAPNVAATAHFSHPVKQGLIQTLGVFTDTLVICTCTAFIILFGGVPDASLNGIQLTQAALESEIGPAGGGFVAVAIFLFAFSSIIGNYYYGEANIRFITPRPWALTLYRMLVGAMVLFGSVATLDLAWSLADVTMALMTLCNLAAIVLLGRQAFLLLADYTAQKRQGIKNPVFTKDRIPELKDKAECW